MERVASRGIPVFAAVFVLAGCFGGGGFNPDLDISYDVIEEGVDGTPDVVTDVPTDTPTECADDDGDGVCNEDDVCPGGDDAVDTDGDTIPDFCDCEGLECGDNAHCEDTGDGPECVCDEGYEGDGMTCTDVDECALGTAGCDANATCTNTDGGFDCVCDDGWEGDGFTCTDVDECSLETDTCDANATCTNTDGGYTCACNTGYDGDGHTCTAIDHCARGTDSCDTNATCTYTGPGTYTCACNTGYSGDGFTCTAIDHCAAGTHTCDRNATCTYTGPGTYTCACNSGYIGDGFTCTPASTGGCYTYSESFTSGSLPSTSSQCTNWNTWRASLPSSGLTDLTMSGSADPTGVSCTHAPTVQAMADAMRTETAGSWTCDGLSWEVGDCGTASWTLSASGYYCGCPSPGYIARPCISNPNWGGIGTATCSGPTQTMEVEFCGELTGTVRRVDGTWVPVSYELCGGGSPGSCTAPAAMAACSAVGKRLVSHATDDTTSIYDLGATDSCFWSVSYFTIDTAMGTDTCLVGIANLEWSGCCTTSTWHGNTIAFGTAGAIFGFVDTSSTGYVSSYPNVTGERWGCFAESTPAENLTGCTTQYVACAS